ncbi:MAG: sensor hybrid histidine kinase [Verrucomicrobiales bacterium]|nr:sensor hybrid histidine kinase [Verrucomicrobiales bacterium]
MSGFKINILVVDDYPANLLALSAVLSDPVYHLIEAGSGPAALKVLETEDVALILLDIQMPEMDGYEVARRIRSNPRTREIPIIFITAHFREEPAVRQGYAAGAQDYLGKPFDPEVLKAKVTVYTNLFLKTVQLESEKRLLKESEERYRLMIEAAREIIASIDNKGTITSLNLSFERLTGHKCDAWIGKSFLPLLEQKDAADFVTYFHRKAYLENAQLIQIGILSENGKPIPVEISLSPLKRNDETVGVVGVIRDVSHRLRA